MSWPAVEEAGEPFLFLWRVLKFKRGHGPLPMTSELAINI